MNRTLKQYHVDNHQQLKQHVRSVNCSISSLLLVYLFILSQLAGCSPAKQVTIQKDGPPPFSINSANIPNAVPKIEPLSQSGNKIKYTVYGRHYYVMKNAAGYRAKGIASWYGMTFHNRKTSSGEFYNIMSMTAAHRTLPLPTYVQVTNLKNSKKVIVKVNDRGPFVGNRLIDLSYVAAHKLGLIASGTGLVEVRAITPRRPRSLLVPTVNHTNQHLPSKSQIFLQLGLFHDRNNAENLAQKAKKYSPSPQLVKIKTRMISLRPAYAVEVGPFSNLLAAKHSQKLMLATGLTKVLLKKV